MRRNLALGVFVMLITACSPAPSETAADRARKDASGPGTLPDCTTVSLVDLGADGWKHPDCRGALQDGSGLAFEARYEPAEDDSTQITVDISSVDHSKLQSISERMGNTIAAPSLQDLDSDGKKEILIPLETGNVNTTWAVWRQTGSLQFVRAGELSGVSIETTSSGFIATPARSSANEWAISFFKADSGQLIPQVTVRVVAQGEPDKITGVVCSIEDDGGLASLALAPEEARARFCAEPIVADTFKS